MKCRECQCTLTELWLTDIANMRVNPMLLFCSNPDCVLFGLITVVGLKGELTLEERLKTKTKTND